MKNRSLLFSLLLMLTGCGQPAAQTGITVFAASSLADVLEEIGRAYTEETRVPVRMSFAASSALARQIESGAPAGVFVSADEDWMDYLATRGLIRADSRTDVAGNALVLIAPADSDLQLKIAPQFALAPALGLGGRLATADPDSVPAGRYAKAALVKLGVWEDVAQRLVPADNVRSALAFVALGETPLGIVYATDALGNEKVRVVDIFPAETHDRIAYPAAVTTRGVEDDAAFVRFLRGGQAQDIFARYGFTAPADMTQGFE